MRTVVLKLLYSLTRLCLTVVSFFRDFYKLTLNAYICKPLLTATVGANDHNGLAGPTSRNRQSCENLKISFENLSGKVRNILGATVLAKNFQT